ncbi:MAG: CsbD family protein, partial [Aeromicrobium sp.]
MDGVKGDYPANDRVLISVHDERTLIMGLGDKISNAAEEAKGKIKEATGKATDDESLEAEGK